MASKDKEKKQVSVQDLQKQIEQMREMMEKRESEFAEKLQEAQAEKEAALAKADEAQKLAKKSAKQIEKARKKVVSGTNKFRICRLDKETQAMVERERTFKIGKFNFRQSNTLPVKDEIAAAEKETILKVDEQTAKILRKKPFMEEVA